MVKVKKILFKELLKTEKELLKLSKRRLELKRLLTLKTKSRYNEFTKC